MAIADDPLRGPAAQSGTPDSRVIRFSAEGRNVLRDQILERLETASNDLWIVAETGDAVATRTLTHEVKDDLLLLDEVGWERHADDEVSVALPRDLLRAALSRHCHHALLRKGNEFPDEIGARWNAERNELLISMLSRALAELDQQ